MNLFSKGTHGGRTVDGLIEFSMSWDGDEDELGYWVWHSNDDEQGGNGSTYDLRRLQRNAPRKDIPFTDLMFDSPHGKLVEAEVLHGDDIRRMTLRRAKVRELFPGLEWGRETDDTRRIRYPWLDRTKRQDKSEDAPRPKAECVHKPHSRDSEPPSKVKAGHSDLAQRHVVVMTEEDDDVRLSCHYCDEEEETGQKETDAEKLAHEKSVLWYRLSRKRHRLKGLLYNLKEVVLDLSNDVSRNRVFVTDFHTLVIKRSTRRDAGSFFCRYPEDWDMKAKGKLSVDELTQLIENPKLRFMYHVDVVKVKDIKVKKVTAKNSTDGLPMPSLPVDVEDMNVRVSTQWEEWSLCSICGTPGTRKRVGVCHVSKINTTESASPAFLNAILSSYANGIPCRSSLLHDHEALSHLIYKPEEVMEEMCQLTCAEHHAQMLLSPRGFLGGDPDDPSKKLSVPERYKEDEGDQVTLKCPVSPLDLPALWTNGSNVLLPNTAANMSDGRATIDDRNTLRINPALPFDSATYVCVVGGQVKGWVRLEIKAKPPECKTCRYALYIMMSFPVDFAIYLFIIYSQDVQRRKARGIRQRRLAAEDG